MISPNIYQKSPVRSPAFKNLLSLLETAISNKQLKWEITVEFPLRVVARNTRRFAQVPKSTCQSNNEWTARLGVMNNTHYGWLRKRTIDHHVPFEYVRCQAKHSELKCCMLRGQLKQVR